MRGNLFKEGFLLLYIQLAAVPVCHGAADWMSFTWDNDLFVGSDDGYTNGGFVSWFDTGRHNGHQPEAPWVARPLLWTMTEEKDPLYRVNAHTFGHMMVTPDDITLDDPDPNDIPYSGLFYYVGSHLKVYANYADMVGVTLGFIGDDSGAETVQKFFHENFSGEYPQGWHHQLEDELVFKLSRERIWRGWVSPGGNTDLVFAANLNIGTLESSLGGYVMLRYGTHLAKSYATSAYHRSRAINSVAFDGGWHAYAGLGARYLGNLIFTDGNTFKNSPSVEIDPAKIGFTAGVSSSWHDFVLTLAIEDMALNEEEYEGIERYASFTVGFRNE